MKKLALFAIVALLVSVPVFAQTTSTSKVITATISANLTITGGLTGGSQVIPANGGTTSLGNITIASNISGEWNVTISSAKYGRMKATDIAENIPYTVTFRPAGNGTTPVINALSLGDGTVSGYTPRSATVNTGVATVIYTLEVTNSAFSASLPAGTYDDTITLTISTNRY